MEANVESQCSGNFLGPVRVTLLATPSDRGYEQAIFFNSTRLPMVGLGKRSSHKTHDPQPVPPERCAGAVLAKSWGRPINE